MAYKFREKIPSLFEKEARNAKLYPNPVSYDIDISLWRDASSQKEFMNCRDLSLIRSAIFFGEEIRGLRNSHLADCLSEISNKNAILMAISTMNYQDKCIESYSKSIKPKKIGQISMADHWLHLPLLNQPTGQEISINDATDGLGDAIDWWLRKAVRLQSGYASLPNDIEQTIRQALAFFTIEKGITNLWQQALWEDWRISEEEASTAFSPHDKKFEMIQTAWHYRSNSKYNAYSIVGAFDWRHRMDMNARKNSMLPKHIKSAVYSENIIIDFRAENSVPLKVHASRYFLNLKILEKTYLAQYLDEKMPDNGLSIRTIVAAWSVLCEVVELIKKINGTTIPNAKSIERWAYSIEKNCMHRIIETCLACDSDEADRIVKLLTWSVDSYKGIWGAPLVPVSDSNFFGLASTPLLRGNLVRTIEIMMKKSGLSDDLKNNSRGIPFERAVRAKLKAAIEKNTQLTRSLCAASSLTRGKAGEEIDIILKLHNKIFIADAKCWLFPSDPIEVFYTKNKIKKAINQIKRKTDWATQNISIVANHLCLPENEIKNCDFISLIVTNQVFGSSIEDDSGNCVITDFDFLELFLSGGKFSSGMMVDSDGKEVHEWTHLYYTEEGAAKKIMQILKDPPVLAKFHERLVWGWQPFPTSDQNPFFYASCSLGEHSEGEALRIWAMEQRLRR